MPLQHSYYARIVLNFRYSLCSKLCPPNRRSPTLHCGNTFKWTLKTVHRKRSVQRLYAIRFYRNGHRTSTVPWREHPLLYIRFPIPVLSSNSTNSNVYMYKSSYKHTHLGTSQSLSESLVNELLFSCHTADGNLRTNLQNGSLELCQLQMEWPIYSAAKQPMLEHQLVPTELMAQV